MSRLGRRPGPYWPVRVCPRWSLRLYDEANPVVPIQIGDTTPFMDGINSSRWAPPLDDMEVCTQVWDGADFWHFQGKSAAEMLPNLEYAFQRLGGPPVYERWQEQPHYWVLWWLESMIAWSRSFPQGRWLVRTTEEPLP